MKALLVSTLPRGAEWVYEVKFDGFRVLAVKDGRKVTLISRNAKDLTDRYQEVTQALESLPATQCVLDGEMVAVDRQGRSVFQLLQAYRAPNRVKPPLYYYVFDLLNLEGRLLTSLPLEMRKQLLEQLLRGAPDTLRYSASLAAEAGQLVTEMRTQGLEGLIAKLRESRYEVGQRTGAWAKFKWNNEQEFVIGGYTPPRGSRSYFGALLVGYYDHGQLRFASKVGAGFDHRSLASLHRCFQRYIQGECPFVNLPERLPSGLSAAEMRTCTWLKPELVCQIRFTEWTRDSHLRHPLFVGLREDKAAHDVVREQSSGANLSSPLDPAKRIGKRQGRGSAKDR
jgi:bifunctional non-homologous end joining protein LigD